MGKALNLTNQKFGKLTALYPTKERKDNLIVWYCQCECGKDCKVTSRDLKSGRVKSCGCLVSPNLTNQKFGKLTVLYKTKEKTNINIKWHCKCECGNKCDVTTHHLISGHTKSCGCLKAPDLTNQKFGELTVLYKLPELNDKRENVWHCKCKCGNEIDLSSSRLNSGNTKSCGCSKSNLISEKITKNLIGQIFGKLTVLEKTDERKNNNVLWKCQCECGNIVKIRGSSLIAGTTQSCGCLNSKGEYKIIQILKNLNIFFETQYQFEDCIFLDTNYHAKFDFYLPNKNIIIEYDGIQHIDNHYNWGSKENFIKTFKHDLIKNQYCLEHNIPLYRIPYSEYENINTLEDILQDKYLVKTTNHYNIQLSEEDA